MSEITVTPESYRTSQITPIVLSESERVQISFEGLQVDNLHNLKKNIKGKLVIKRKNKEIDSFTNVEKFSKKDIASKEYVEIALSTEETYNLALGLYRYYQLLSGKQTNPFSEITYVLKDQRVEQLKALMSNRQDLLDALANIDIDTLNTALNIENLRRVKQQMLENIDNDQEVGFWQQFFESNAWILAQLFHAPVMFFQGKKYLGGKGIDDHGGQYADFIYKNEITDNVAIIEIKSPMKPLFGKPYRQSYSISEELSGGINQLLKQKTELMQNYSTLYASSAKKGTPFCANNIDCVLVIGKVGILQQDQQEAFDTYRNELRSIRIIGFDELLKRIDNLLSIFGNSD